MKTKPKSTPLPVRSNLPIAIELRPVGSLKPWLRNARKHSAKQIRQIADSIETFGFTNPLLIDAEDHVLAGHGRLAAAKLLGFTEIPTLRLDHLNEEQRRAYVIADNRLAEKSGWDRDILAIEIQALVELEFDVQLTGFETGEIDLLISKGDEEEGVAEPDLKLPVVSRLGDRWSAGRHRILCGDSTEPASYLALMADERAQMVFTDPPYNVPVGGHMTVADKQRHGEFVMASGEMSPEQFTLFLGTVIQLLAAHSIDSSIHYLCMDWRHLGEMLAAGQRHYAEFKNLCVWAKDNGGMGSLYRSRHELVFVFKNGTAPHINNIELGKHGRYRTNVWNYAGATSLGKGRSQRLAMHPTVKPVVMIADAMLDCSDRNGLVLDPFGGSGSTLIAAETTGRRAALIELDPRYVDVSIRRFQRHSGLPVTHADSGLSFEETAQQRLAVVA